MEKNLAEAGGAWYLGKRSFADTYLYVLARWIEQTPMAIADFPAIEAHRGRMQEDAGVRTALARQGMEPV